MIDHILEMVLVVVVILAVSGFGLAGRHIYRDTRPTTRYNYKTDGKYADLRTASIEAGKLDQKQRWDNEISAIVDHHEKRKKHPWKWLRGETDESIDAERIREVRQTAKRFTMPDRQAMMGGIHPKTGENHRGGVGRAGHGRRAHLRPDGSDPTKKRRITANRSKPQPATESKWPRDTKHGGK